MEEFPAHVTLVNHWFDQNAFDNFALIYKRWQNNGTPLGDDAFDIMRMLTLGHIPTTQLSIGLMRIATEDQRTDVVGSDGSEWNTEFITNGELFYIPEKAPSSL